VLAYSRRLLEGQVPHRDFISIRPAGSALLHLPVVWLGGALTFWISRYVVWLEFAGIAVAWLALARRLPGWRPSVIIYLATALIAVMLSTHTFAIMAWHTVDAILLTSVGLVLATREGARARTLGVFLVGCAYLCRQNFLLFGPVALVVLGHGRRRSSWAALLLPGAAYAGFLAANGALGDARVQLGAQGGFVGPMFAPFAKNPFMYGGIALGMLGSFGLAKRGAATAGGPGGWWVDGGGMVLIGTVTAACALVGRMDYFLGPAVGLFAVAVGALLIPVRNPADRRVLMALAVLLALVTTVSIGLDSPVLAAGPLAVAILALAFGVPDGESRPALRPMRQALLIATALVGLVCWGVGRAHIVARDRPMSELHAPIGDVMPGTTGLKTNPDTRAFLEDLAHAVARVHGRRVAILPDLAAYWVRSPQRNPLSIDWPQETELATPALEARVCHDLESQRGTLVVLVQKVSAATIAYGWRPLGESHYGVVRFVRSRFRKVGETAFFDVYE